MRRIYVQTPCLMSNGLSDSLFVGTRARGAVGRLGNAPPGWEVRSGRSCQRRARAAHGALLSGAIAAACRREGLGLGGGGGVTGRGRAWCAGCLRAERAAVACRCPRRTQHRRRRARHARPRPPRPRPYPRAGWTPRAAQCSPGARAPRTALRERGGPLRAARGAQSRVRVATTAARFRRRRRQACRCVQRRSVESQAGLAAAARRMGPRPRRATRARALASAGATSSGQATLTAFSTTAMARARSLSPRLWQEAHRAHRQPETESPS